MPACLAAMEHSHTYARRAGRETRRCPPVWQPWSTATHMPDRRAEDLEDARLSGSHGAQPHICQTGGPRNQKMPACLAAMEHSHTYARQAGRGTRRCPPVWQPWSTATHMPDRRAEDLEDARLSGSHGAQPHICQTGGPRNQKMPACLAATLSNKVINVLI